MIIEAIPLEYRPIHSELVSEGFKIFDLRELPKSPNERDQVVSQIAQILNNVPYPADRPDAEIVKGRFLSSVGIVFGMLVAEENGWEFCWMRKEDEKVDDGVKSVVSSDRSYFVYPIGVVYKEARRHGDECRKVYEKIKTGNLPDVPAGSFFEITA